MCAGIAKNKNMALTSDMVQLLDAGVAHQVAGCTNAGRPVVCRGLAAQLEADGRLVVVISSLSGFEVLDAGVCDECDISSVRGFGGWYPIVPRR